MSKVRKSLLISFGQNYIGIVLQFFSSVIIARLLTPHEIGIFSVAMVLIGFAHTLRDSGVSSYVIQEKELTQDKIRSAFAMTLITAWIMAAAIGLGSGYAADFYREPGIRSVMLILSINFILIPFGSVPIAYMHRQMDFHHIALITIIPNIVSTIASVGLAYSGFSYLSMALGSVSGAVCTILLVQVWRPKGLPFLPGLKEIRNVFSFGMLSNFMMILLDVTRGVPDLIIGRLSGMATVGYYGRSMGLVSMFEKLVMKALWTVALPHFAEQSRNKGFVKDNFLRSTTFATALAWPFFACMGILAHPIVVALYGQQWEPSVPMLKLLCIAMFITSPFLMLGSMITAIGQMKQNVFFLVIHAPILVVFVFMAAPFGLKAVGVVFVVVNLIDAIIYLWQCQVILGVNVKEIAKALRESAGVTLLSAALPAIMLLLDGTLSESLWFQLLFGLAGSMVGWLTGIFLFRHPLRVEIGNIFLTVKNILFPVKTA